ncbi:MAG: beta-N-acetylhexosaminidase [Victivallaceae bacterium]|nr:beta-N-acetylhexosaminidase [Victivallaceae bacterium]
MKKLFSSLLALVAAVISAGEFDDIASRLAPVPHKIEIIDAACLDMRNPEVSVFTKEKTDDAKKAVEKTFGSWWNAKARVAVSEGGDNVADEGYQLDTTQGKVIITARDMRGILNAMRSMRQLAEPERGTASGTGFVIPHVRIDDYPEMKFRGLHFLHTRNCKPYQLERAIRLAAYFKYNYFVLEPCGTYKFKSHPEYCFDGMLDEKEIKRLVKIGRENGITLVPAIPVFGHTGFGGIGSGTHALLDSHPELAPLFEPSGWTWCISNPHAVKFIDDLLAELADAFENPPYFSIGGDEAYNAGSCSLCRQGDYKRKIADHFRHVSDVLKARGMRALMWHDMLFKADDPAWLGSTANGSEKLEGLRSLMPRDIVLCYWEYRFAKHPYRAPEKGVDGFPIVDVARKDGFDVICSAWMYDTTTALGRKAKEAGCLGILQTTWGQMVNSHNHHTMLSVGGTSGWNPAADCPQVTPERSFTVDWLNRFVRDVNHDMGLTKPEETRTN